MLINTLLYPLLALILLSTGYGTYLQTQNAWALLVTALLALLLIIYLSVQRVKLSSALSHSDRELQNRLNELKQSQTHLVQTEKMSSLGQMVAGIAHEINTPLAYTRSNTVLVESQLGQIDQLVLACAQQADYLLSDQEIDEDQLAEQISQVAILAQEMRRDKTIDEMRELLQNNANGLDTIADLVSNLKNFSRLDRQQVASVDLNAGLESVLIIARNELKYKVDIIKDFGKLPTVRCSPSQINQVFLNLIVNAAQAIEQQGTITLRTSASKSHVKIEIADTGKGIPDEVLPNIFDPFFTTKDIGEGTGLGLSIAYRIVQQHGGSLNVESAPGQGTKFIMTLPLISQLQEDSLQNSS
jgi:signal transduction histidine kinase